MGGAQPAPVQAAWKGGWVPAAKLESNICWERLSQQLSSWSRETLNCKQKNTSPVWYRCPVKWSFRHQSSRWGLCLLELLEVQQDPRLLSSAPDSSGTFGGVYLLSVFLLMYFIYSELWKGAWASFGIQICGNRFWNSVLVCVPSALVKMKDAVC